MTEVHRKIELQEQDDLRYLINNVQRAAHEKIDLALPPIDGEDALRQRVEELVAEYITTTFQTASPNISINGHDPAPTLLISLLSTEPDQSIETTEEYEPLDSKLLSRAADLARQEEDLLIEIAALRREAPVKVAETWKEVGRSDDEALKGFIGRMRDEKAPRQGSAILDLGVQKMERQVEVEKTWKRGVDGLESLKMEMPGTAARMERGKRAAEYVLAER